MTDVLTVDAQRELAAEAHRFGVVDLQVLVLLSNLRQVLLIEHCPSLSRGLPPQWTIPNTFVLPGELICHALERLCCQHLHLDPAAWPSSFLGVTTLQEPEIEQYLFAVNVSGSPHVLTGTDSDNGARRWWNIEDGRPMSFAPGIRQALASVRLLSPTGSLA
ncbi:hypothetical protein ACFY41_28250 [Streptomyces syringium]|uniref:hypothetical protein n=1 Tax=Streptomyces syringium TaxID=76729 RepID=UPI0036BEE159